MPDCQPEDQINNIKNFGTFLEFTDALEIGPHNGVHGVVGGRNPTPNPNLPFDRRGTMSDLYISPLDILFWCHHANIDRIWAEWQKKQIETGNTEYMHPFGLSELENQMHPWYPEFTEQRTRTIESMGYSYDIFSDE